MRNMRATRGSSYRAEDNQCPDMDIAFDYTVSNGTVSFDDQSMIDYTAFLWNFGDGDFAETRLEPTTMPKMALICLKYVLRTSRVV